MKTAIATQLIFKSINMYLPYLIFYVVYISVPNLLALLEAFCAKRPMDFNCRRIYGAQGVFDSQESRLESRFEPPPPPKAGFLLKHGGL